MDHANHGAIPKRRTSPGETDTYLTLALSILERESSHCCSRLKGQGSIQLYLSCGGSKRLRSRTYHGRPSRMDRDGMCVVCVDNGVDTLIIPCGHVCICETCLPLLSICPICRGAVEGSHRAYLSTRRLDFYGRFLLESPGQLKIAWETGPGKAKLVLRFQPPPPQLRLRIQISNRDKVVLFNEFVHGVQDLSGGLRLEIRDGGGCSAALFREEEVLEFRAYYALDRRESHAAVFQAQVRQGLHDESSRKLNAVLRLYYAKNDRRFGRRSRSRSRGRRKDHHRAKSRSRGRRKDHHRAKSRSRGRRKDHHRAKSKSRDGKRCRAMVQEVGDFLETPRRGYPSRLRAARVSGLVEDQSFLRTAYEVDAESGRRVLKLCLRHHRALGFFCNDVRCNLDHVDTSKVGGDNRFRLVWQSLTLRQRQEQSPCPRDLPPFRQGFATPEE
jgi:hypothetical protein